MIDLTVQAWFALGSIAVVVCLLIHGRIAVDVAMVGGLTLLMLGDAVLGGVLPVESAIAGFAHPAIMMIGSLFVVAAGMQQTGGIEFLAQRLLGHPRSIAGAQLRLMAPVAVLSGFMNNTPIVAMYLPIVSDWAKKLGISPSKLYIPLSFAAILGGKITLIGTASNIVVMNLWLVHAETNELAQPLGHTMQFWGVAALGVPTTVLGLAIIVMTSRWLLPERRPAIEDVLDARRYMVDMVVEPSSPIVGKSIEEAGLRHLSGLYLARIERGDDMLHAVGPEERLQPGDRLAFVGILDSVVELRKIRGLVPDTDQVQKVQSNPRQRTLVEAVVSRHSPLVGQTVRASMFRSKYNAAILAVRRSGEHLDAKVGDIRLQPADTLLLDTHAGFVDAYRNSNDFYLVSKVEGSTPILHDRAWIALAIFALLVVLLTATRLNPVAAAFTCAGLMVATRCVSATVARSRINWQVLFVIGSALGMGAAMRETGADVAIAGALLDLCDGSSPGLMLLIIFLITSAFAQFVTNNGAAVLMFPIAMATAADLGVSPIPFIFTLMVAAGSIFISPVSYQTNLMVYGPGGYRFTDYARIGVPLTLALAVACALLAPLFFPFGGSG